VRHRSSSNNHTSFRMYSRALASRAKPIAAGDRSIRSNATRDRRPRERRLRLMFGGTRLDFHRRARDLISSMLGCWLEHRGTDRAGQGPPDRISRRIERTYRHACPDGGDNFYTNPPLCIPLRPLSSLIRPPPSFSLSSRTLRDAGVFSRGQRVFRI